MTTTFARVDPETLEVILKYNTNGGPKWAPEDLECTIPFDVLADTATRSEDGTIQLLEDPVRVESKIQTAWTQLRTQRNAKLAATDWVALADAHLSQDSKSAWFAYRQKLRDLPEQVTDSMLVATSLSDSVPWPESPGSS
jgi:hypothetical protein